MDVAQLCSENSVEIDVKSVKKLLIMNSNVDVDTVFCADHWTFLIKKLIWFITVWVKSQPHSL